MRAFTQKQKPTQQAKSGITKSPSRALAGQSRGVSTSTSSRYFQCYLTGLSQIPPMREQKKTKLAINKTGDEYEQEADRVAEQMISMPEPVLDRRCVCGGACPRCKTDQLRKEREHLDTRRVQESDMEQVGVPTVVHEVLAGPGQPLDRTTRAVMEPRFGYDFSQIRVHTDSKAARSAQAVNALAYTVGRDMVFGTGQYAPASYEGQRLLAHELTHVVQQCKGTGDATIMRWSHQMGSNKITRTGSMSIMRTPNTSMMQSAMHELIHQRPWNQLPEALRKVYEKSYKDKKLIGWMMGNKNKKNAKKDENKETAEENFNKFALNQKVYGHYISLLQMYKALNDVGLWKEVEYLVVSNYGVDRARFSIVFIPKNTLLGELKGNKGFCRDIGIGRGGRKNPSFRQMVTDGTEALHITISPSTTEAHIDWISPVEGRDSNGYCNYDILRHGLRHAAWEKKGCPYIPQNWKFSDIPIY